jgi:serine/threonine-protein kinase PknG
VLIKPEVPETRRFCGRCDAPVGRGRDGVPGRITGFCTACGAPFSFAPRLAAGDVVAGQYEVRGCLAHGGLGWIYLATDRNVHDRRVILKGLIDTADPDALAAAVSERRFLAEVAHPNIVEIYNFVQHPDPADGTGAGYIVMEYVSGQPLRGPLPVHRAIADVLEILPALDHLHQRGLLYCDFKPDNVIRTPSGLKLIDLGGVRRADDDESAIYGTVGFQAPEVEANGPSVRSDLYSVGRTLAALCPPEQAGADAYERLLSRATHPEPDRRFGSATDLAEQLAGVLRECLAAAEGEVRSAPGLGRSGEAASAQTWRRVSRLFGPEPRRLSFDLTAPPDPARVAASLPAPLVDDDAGWPGVWRRAVDALAAGRQTDATAGFTEVYDLFPGEAAPKLAVAACSTATVAAALYETVWRTDHAYVSAAVGLARIRLSAGDPDGAVAALDGVPDGSPHYRAARLAALLTRLSTPSKPTAARVADLLDRHAALDLVGRKRAEIDVAVLEATLSYLEGWRLGTTLPAPHGARTERSIREELERTYRAMARQAERRRDRVALVAMANAVRPRTWL